ncbi:MAG: hypothetical protein AB8B55_13660 [Mariniblastus sp.]
MSRFSWSKPAFNRVLEPHLSAAPTCLNDFATFIGNLRATKVHLRVNLKLQMIGFFLVHLRAFALMITYDECDVFVLQE